MSRPGAPSCCRAAGPRCGTLEYAPRGSDGFTCTLRTSAGHLIEVDSTEPARVETVFDVPADATVAAVEQYAQHEFGRRRTRNQEYREHHEKHSERWQKEALRLGDALDRVTGKSDPGWCSACLELTEHRRLDKRGAFLCASCGAPTAICAVPRCNAFANRSKGQKGQARRFCAEHAHDIPGFEKASAHLEALDEYTEFLEYEKMNVRRSVQIGTLSLAGAAALAPLALVAAPAIGGAVGAASGLSGAAATSHGLAVLGGGSLATGGLGMAGGIAVVTAGGAGLGGVTGASVASAYVRSDDSFKFERVRSGSGPTVVFANGFLSEGQIGWGEWERLVHDRFPDATVYRLGWGAKELKSLGFLVGGQAVGKVGKELAKELAKRATKDAAKFLGPISAVFGAAGIAKNPWYVAKARAKMTGSVLADALVRADVKDVVLIGFSLGGQVVVSAAEALSTRNEEPRIREMHLIGAAVTADRDWRVLDGVVQEQIWNYWSANDLVLKYLFRAGGTGVKAAGQTAVASGSRTIKNRNVSSKVESHRAYLSSVALQ